MRELWHQLTHRNKLVGRLIGAFPGQQVVHGDAEGIDIRPGIGLGLTELFRSGIALGTDVGRVRIGLLFIFPGDTEVDQLQRAVRLEHDVGGLHVPVDDRVGPLTVEIGQHAA